MENGCKSCLHLVNQKKTCFTDLNILNRKPANEYHPMLPWFVGEYKSKTSTISLETSKDALITAEKPTN